MASVKLPYFITISIAILQVNSAFAGEGSSEVTSKKTANTTPHVTYYFDSRGFNTLNILTITNALPWGFNIFGFTDLHGDHSKSGQRFDLTRYFMSTGYAGPFPPNMFLVLPDWRVRWNTMILRDRTTAFCVSVSLVVEGRFNGYEDANPTIKGVGVAFGLKFISKD